MSIEEQVQRFTALHEAGNPLIVCNAWDVGSARAVERAGALAIATSSAAVAAAQGYEDGEALPLDTLLALVRRMTVSLRIPLSVDFEGAYATDARGVAINARRLLENDIVGLNFEDRIVSGVGLYAVDEQAERIRALVASAAALGRSVFINARTDLFLANDAARHPGLVAEAIVRGRAYADAGASGFFVPGLADEKLLEHLAEAIPLPLNAMVTDLSHNHSGLASAGVARISFGPAIYLAAMDNVEKTAGALHAAATVPGRSTEVV